MGVVLAAESLEFAFGLVVHEGGTLEAEKRGAGLDTLVHV